MYRTILKKIVQKTGLLLIYNKIDKLRNNINSDYIECSIGDILLLRETFPYQNTISRKVYGKNHLEEEGKPTI